jgi:hypothetical protein
LTLHESGPWARVLKVPTGWFDQGFPEEGHMWGSHQGPGNHSWERNFMRRG